MLVLRLWGRGVAELRLRTPGERGGGTSERFQLQLSSYVQVARRMVGLKRGYKYVFGFGKEKNTM